MKLILRISLVLVALAMTAALQIGLSSSGTPTVTSNVALAVVAPEPNTAPSTTSSSTACSASEVELSISVLPGKKCIPNDQPGGAIVAYLSQILTLASMAIGAVIMLMLVVAGIQYITSTGQPDQIKAAKTRIINAITALILFLMTYAIINFLIPGGLF